MARPPSFRSNLLPPYLEIYKPRWCPLLNFSVVDSDLFGDTEAQPISDNLFWRHLKNDDFDDFGIPSFVLHS